MTVESIPEPARKSVLAPVQVLRAVAASMVVVAHCHNHADRKFLEPQFANLGTFGVAIFFIISGFIMYHTTRRQWVGDWKAAREFFARRLHRIVPLYWLMTTLTLCLFFLDPERLTAKHVVLSYLFIPYDFDGVKFRPIVGVGWTLDFEMFFYALFTLALLLPKRIGLPAIIVVLATLAANGRYALTQPIILLFGFGILLGLIRDSVTWRLSPRVYALAPIALSVAAIIALWFTPAVSKMIFLPLLWAASLAFVGHAIFAPEGHRSSRFGLLLGDASYLLYLVHPMVVLVISTVTLHLGLRSLSERVIVACFMFLACISIAVAGHRWVEKPLNRLTAPLFGRGRTVRMPALQAAAR